MSYETDVTIDPDALDVEWLRQPQLMIKYAKISAEAKMEVLSAKENLDLVRAELDKDIRSDPDKFGIAKITESAVLNTIISNQRYKKANSEYLEKQYEYEMSRGAIQALEHKKDALENLVRLFGQQYFAGPNVPRDLSFEWQRSARSQESNSIVHSKMARKK